MRLTLRTMLAYMDDVLEPSDAEQLRQKIEESEFASNLVHRLRNVTRKLRLSAPKLAGKGMGLDSNTVSEYLDSTLSPDRVPDFEKVCLESDVHLAEVASCHQVLALVLGEPADVSVNLRDRIYALGNGSMPPQSSEPVEPAASTTPEHAADDAAVDDSEQETETLVAAATTVENKSPSPPMPKSTKSSNDVGLGDLPDYARTAGWRRYIPLIATVALVLLIGIVAIFAIGPSTIAGLFGGGSQEPVANNDTPIQQPDSVLPITKQNNPDDDEPKKNLDDESTDKKSDTGWQTAKSPKPTESETDDNGFTVVPRKDPPVEDAKPGDLPANNDFEPPQPAPIPGVIEPAPADPMASSAPMPVNPDTVEPKPGVPMPKAPIGGETIDLPDAPGAALGRYTSEKQIITRIDGEGNWLRLDTGQAVVSGSRFYTLPTYRAQIALSTGIQATVVGPAMLKLDSKEATPTVDLEFGKTVLMTIGRAGSQIGLNVNGRQGTLTFATADASVAIEVKKYRAPGTDPEAGPVHAIAQIESNTGEIEWKVGDETIKLAQGEVYVMVDDKLGQTITLAEPSTWISSSELELIDRLASEELEAKVSSERPLIISLLERTKDEDVEIRMLASRSLAYLDRHESFVTSLGNDENRSFWDAGYLAVQDALSRSPESAKAVRLAFEKMRAENGEKLYRLLWGYNSEQLADLGAAKLVDDLESPDLDFRVLAFINLYRITGKMNFYQPHVTERRRATKVAKWRDMAEKGEIVYAVPPSLPLPVGTAKE